MKKIIRTVLSFTQAQLPNRVYRARRHIEWLLTGDTTGHSLVPAYRPLQKHTKFRYHNRRYVL